MTSDTALKASATHASKAGRLFKRIEARDGRDCHTDRVRMDAQARLHVDASRCLSDAAIKLAEIERLES